MTPRDVCVLLGLPLCMVQASGAVLAQQGGSCKLTPLPQDEAGINTDVEWQAIGARWCSELEACGYRVTDECVRVFMMTVRDPVMFRGTANAPDLDKPGSIEAETRFSCEDSQEHKEGKPLCGTPRGSGQTGGCSCRMLPSRGGSSQAFGAVLVLLGCVLWRAFRARGRSLSTRFEGDKVLAAKEALRLRFPTQGCEGSGANLRHTKGPLASRTIEIGLAISRVRSSLYRMQSRRLGRKAANCPLSGPCLILMLVCVSVIEACSATSARDCALQARYRHETEGVGSAIISFSRRGEKYLAQEMGLMNFTGQATLDNGVLTVDFETKGGFSGRYTWRLDARCERGNGELAFRAGGAGTHASKLFAIEELPDADTSVVSATGTWSGQLQSIGSTAVGIRFDLTEQGNELAGTMYVEDPETQRFVKDSAIVGHRTGDESAWSTDSELQVSGRFSGQHFTGSLRFPRDEDLDFPEAALKLSRVE